MTIKRLIKQSLRYRKKAHLSLLAAIAFTTAVITGALTIGDTVEYSLKDLVNKRLGSITHVLQTGERYVSLQLSQRLSQKMQKPVAAVFHSSGMLSVPGKSARANSIEVYGIDSAFFDFAEKKTQPPKPGELFINQQLAQKLQVDSGAQVIMKISGQGLIPQNSPFANDNETFKTLRLTVRKIISDENLGLFSIKTDQKSPYNAFLNYKYLTQQIEMEHWVNLLLTESDQKSEQLDSLLEKSMQTTDYALESSWLNDENKLQISSSRIFMDQAVANATQQFEQKEKIIHYLANSLKSNNLETPYSFVAAREVNLQDREILVNQWLADDLKIEIGDSLVIQYFTIGAMRQLQENEQAFVVAEIRPIDAPIFDRKLMPEYPGMSDAGNCRDWETGIPIDLKKIRDKDEQYWDAYRGSPKAIINLKAGKQLWQNQYGSYTGIRIATDSASVPQIKKRLLEYLHPQQLGLGFRKVKQSAMQAAENGVDFGQLFISLSFFVIVAGLLLSGLILRLNLNKTTEELGTLRSLGFSQKRIFAIKFAEIISVALPGVFVGTLLGIAYNYLMTKGLNTIWLDAVKTSALETQFTAQSLIIGFVTALILLLLVAFFTLRKHIRQTIKNLLQNTQTARKHSKYRIFILTAIFGFMASIVLVVYAIYTSRHESTGLFLGSGGLMLLALSSLAYHFLQKPKTDLQKLTFARLIIKNLSYKPLQSLSIIVLLALGTFTVIVTGANRKTFYGLENKRTSGTGGFTFWGESSIPLLHNMGTESGRKSLNVNDEPTLDSMQIVPFTRLSGDDASCLNLNQIESPRILGFDVSQLQNPTAFSFVNLLQHVDPKNPWQALDTVYDDAVYPAFADQTVITWGLIKELGDTLIYTDEFGVRVKFVLTGGLAASVFQGHLLVNRNVLSKHFPSLSGAEVFLLKIPEEQAQEARKTLEYLLADYGIDFQLTTQRLAEFNSITNTYLAIFMILGGLGVLVGTLGMGILILRNINERKNELAGMQALGFSKSKIIRLILTENTTLLIVALITGSVSALIGILPSLLTNSLSGSFGQIVLLILLIFLNGLFWIYITTHNSLKYNLMEGLRNE